MALGLRGMGIIALCLASTASLAAVSAAQVPTFITAWGSYGNGNGQFNNPEAVAVDAIGNVYVLDSGSGYSDLPRVEKFTSNGTYLMKWGTLGTEAGQFFGPRAITVDASGHVYVADQFRIQKFTGDGVFLTQWGSRGTGPGQFADSPLGLAVDGAGDIIATDFLGYRIQKFTSDGTFITQWGSAGGGNGEFNHPAGVAVDGSGNVYVADHWNFRIQKFTNGGIYLAQWGTQGSGPGQFNAPLGVTADAGGTVCVSDGRDRIEVFTSGGEYLAQWGSEGSAAGQFIMPRGIALDHRGNIYVADNENYRIQKFGSVPTPAQRTTWSHLKRLYR